jgi:hypothetical protein
VEPLAEGLFAGGLAPGWGLPGCACDSTGCHADALWVETIHLGVNSMPEERQIGAEMKAHLDAELRRLAVLPPSELEVALRPIIEPFIQMAEAL